MQIEDYKKILKERLTDKRYYHSLCVADEAKRLAIKYGGDVDRAFLAGLLHDITKNAEKQEHFELFDKGNITLSDIEKNSEKLWHAMSGPIYIKEYLDVKDPHVLDAVRYHTTAKKDMSLLELILYLADFTSADRDYEDVEVIRRYVNESLDKAYLYALDYTVNELKQKNAAIHPDTLEAYNEIKKKGISL